MISVITPYMPKPPYDTQVKVWEQDIKGQIGYPDEIEIFIEEQTKQNYIMMAKLMMDGVRHSKGEYLWFSNCDLRIADFQLLKRMKAKIDSDEDVNIIYPVFWSGRYDKWKIADGCLFLKRSTFEKYGGLDETIKGVSWGAYSFLEWAFKNGFYCTQEFKVKINEKPFVRPIRNIHQATYESQKKLRRQIVLELIKRECWPEKQFDYDVFVKEKGTTKATLQIGRG